MSGTNTTRPANIRALEFWKEYAPLPGGEGQRELHWVQWARTGDFHYHKQVDCVQRLMRPRVEQGGMEASDPVWLAIKPAYAAWLEGTAAPVNGTPLDAWSALTKKQAKAFQDAGYKSIEEVAEITDSDLSRVRIPDVRKMRNLARAYMENAANHSHIDEALAKRDEEIDNLKALVAEMTAALKSQQAAQEAEKAA